MLRDILMAWAFGATGAVAAFMVAFRFSHLLRRTLGEGAMQTAFIPQFVAAKHASETRAIGFFRNLTAVISILLVLIIILTEGVLAAAIMQWDLADETTQICKLTMLMLPGLLFICLAGINTALLQCEGRYFLASVAPIAFNVVWITGVLLLSGWTAPAAMPWLAGAVSLACFAQWLATVPAVAKITSGAPWTLDVKSQDMKNLFKALSLGIIGVSSTQINSAIDAIFATMASVEGPAYLWYAIRIQQLPLGVFGIALSGALLPALSRAIKAGDIARSSHYMNFAVRQACLVILPATFGLFAAGGAIVNLLFGHGDFTEFATIQTTYCLWGYAIGLPAAVLILLYGPGFYANNDYATPARGVVYTVLLGVGLNYLAVCQWSMGPVAVAVTTSIAAWANAAYLHFKLRQRIGTIVTSETFVDIAKILSACSVALATAVFWNSPAISRDVLTQMIECTKACSIFTVVFAVTCLVLRLDLMWGIGMKEETGVSG